MSAEWTNWLDFGGVLLGALLTLIVLSYVLGDHFLFRLVIYGFIGVAAGFGVILAFNSVIYPLLFQPLVEDPIGGIKSAGLPLLFSLLLMFKLSRRWSLLGNPSLAFLTGVGAAVLIGGALRGTLFPQLLAVINSFDTRALPATAGSKIPLLIEAVIALLGTVATLAYFHFGARPQASGPAKRPDWLETLGWIGQMFIAIALGLIYAGILRAGYTALVERAHFLVNMVISLLGAR